MQGDLLLQTTFQHPRELERAREALARLRLPYERIEPTAALARVALPALVMTRDARAQLEAALPDLTVAGWVEHRPGVAVLPQGPAPTGEEAPFGRAAIVVLTPCVADDTKIRIIAHITGDLEPVMPYLNAVMPGVSYSDSAKTLTYTVAHRMIAIYPRRIAVAKADEVVDAWLVLEGIRRQACETWSRRGEIEPSFETRKRPPALEIFKRLPGTNCGLCGEMTCMAFALRLWAGEVGVRQCTPVFLPENEARRAALLEICSGLGISNDGPNEEDERCPPAILRRQ